MLAGTLQRRTLARAHPRTRSSLRRLIATAPSGSPTATATALLLQDTRTLLDGYPLLDPVWSARLQHAHADLSLARPARIAVVGDHASDAPGLVTALLDDPLASNPDVTVALEARRLAPHTAEQLTIRHGDDVKSTAAELQVPAHWLADTNAELVEIVHGDVAPLESSVSSLHLADLVILVLSDAALLSSKAAQTLLYDLASKPNLLLALNCLDASPSSSTSPLRTLDHQLKTLLPAAPAGAAEPRALAVSTSQALAALEALSPSEPDQKPAYEAFQKGYIASHIPHLHQLLTAALTSAHAGHPAPTPLQLQTALYVVSAALARAAFAGAQIADSLGETDAALSALEEHASEAQRALLASLGVEPSTGLLRVPADELRGALAALDELCATRLAWYKLPYRVDDLAAEIALVVSQTYLVAFERRLAFSAGLAASTAAALAARTDALFATSQFAPPPAHSPAALPPAARLSSLYSATLLNALEQASFSAAPADATALSDAVAHRRAQLTAPAGGPVAMLHTRAQRAVLRSGTFGALSIAGAGTSEALGWAAQTGTNVGVGLLGVTLAAWGLQRAWLAALKRFRADVARVTGGVEEDLGMRAQSVARRAAWKADVAVRLARERLRERSEAWVGWREAWGGLEARRTALQGHRVGEGAGAEAVGATAKEA